MAAIATSLKRGECMPPSVLGKRLAAAAVTGSAAAQSVFTLCVEGGATAAELAGEMGWTCLAAVPSPELPGVSALRPVATREPLLLVKPGSYPWPQQLWEKLK